MGNERLKAERVEGTFKGEGNSKSRKLSFGHPSLGLPRQAEAAASLIRQTGKRGKADAPGGLAQQA